MIRGLFASVAGGALVLASVPAAATISRTPSPARGSEEIAANPWIPWLAGLLALVVIILVVTDDDDEPASP